MVEMERRKGSREPGGSVGRRIERAGGLREQFNTGLISHCCGRSLAPGWPWHRNTRLTLRPACNLTHGRASTRHAYTKITEPDDAEPSGGGSLKRETRLPRLVTASAAGKEEVLQFPPRNTRFTLEFLYTSSKSGVEPLIAVLDRPVLVVVMVVVVVVVVVVLVVIGSECKDW
ncbi:hypothetical protein E2C01_063380 [Portunus trituberculatus]|uniref:Uncharacterized protein n=1 Tax=Portunus trituberculatus TaxID=210409 RepID=A0A5B7HI01_PORTR|nr:hypothetical protein [Portunus trituberculatus]